MEQSNSKAKSKDAVLTGERHLELPATSPTIPRKISSGRFVKDFPHVNEQAFVLQLVRSIKYRLSHVGFFFHFSVLQLPFTVEDTLWCRNLILIEPAITSTASSR